LNFVVYEPMKFRLTHTQAELVELFNYIIVRRTFVPLNAFLTNGFIAVFLVIRAIANQIHVGCQIILYEGLMKHINRFILFMRKHKNQK